MASPWFGRDLPHSQGVVRAAAGYASLRQNVDALWQVRLDIPQHLQELVQLGLRGSLGWEVDTLQGAYTHTYTHTHIYVTPKHIWEKIKTTFVCLIPKIY